MASATGIMPKKSGKRKVTHIRLTRAANGWTAHHELEPQKTRKPGGAMMAMMENSPEPAVFSGPKADKMAMAHVGNLMSQGADDQDSGAPEPPTAA